MLKLPEEAGFVLNQLQIEKEITFSSSHTCLESGDNFTIGLSFGNLSGSDLKQKQNQQELNQKNNSSFKSAAKQLKTVFIQENIPLAKQWDIKQSHKATSFRNKTIMHNHWKCFPNHEYALKMLPES